MKKRILAGVCAISLCAGILAGCAGSGSEPTSTPTQGSSEAVTDATNQTVMTQKELPLGSENASTNKKRITVKVDNEAVNTVLAGLFGANVSWRGDGYAQWDSDNDAPNAQLLQQLKDSGVTHLRYPGGIEGDYFHWNESIGENRVAQIDPFSADYPTYDTYNGERYVATFGPEEFMELSIQAGDGMTLQVNAGNGTPQEAADWVKYYLEQDAPLWSVAVGNEVCMAEERVAGMTVTCTPQEYVEFYNQVYEALGEDAEKIELGAIGITPMHPLCKYRNWDATILYELSDKIDFIDVHIGYSPYFTSGESQEQIVGCLMASSDWIRQMLDQEISLINKYAGDRADDITIQITEWGPIGGYSTSVAGAVFMASFMNTVTAEPKVSSACYLPLVNHWAAANLLGSLTDYSVAGKQVFWDNTNTYVFRWYSEQIDRQVLKTKLKNADTFDSVAVGLVPAIEDVAVGDASVYYDPATKTGTVFLVNRDYTENVEFAVELPFANVTVTAVTELWHENCVTGNNYANPKKVAPAEYNAGQFTDDGTLLVTTKPISVVRIDFTVAD